MRHKNYYLIKHNNNNHLVMAYDGIEATNIWYETRVKEREEEGIKVRFNPKEFSVLELCTEGTVMRASE